LLGTVSLNTQSDTQSGNPGLRPTTVLPLDVRGGVHPNLMGDGTVTFVLHTPAKPYVSLVGDFNNWDARAHRMVTDGSGTWWITLPHPGPTRYGYYVAIDDQAHAWVGDPYATEVRWEGDEGRAYLPAPEPAYIWHDQAWCTPALRDLVIYELCVRDFAGEWRDDLPHYGTFAGVLERLDYLVGLGVNAIELMPIQAFPGESSWGYNPVFYFAPAQVYGRPDDFKALVDACHQRGIAVLLDVAFNHAWGEHPYYRVYPPMYGEKGEWLTDWNPYFHHTPSDVNMWGGVDWDHFAPITTRYFQDVVRYWLNEYHVDGFRFDWVCGVDYDSNDPLRVGFNPFHGISAPAWAARQTKPDCILCGEFWTLPSTNPAKTAASLVAETEVDACWNGRFHHTLELVLNQRWEWEKQDICRAIGGFREDGYRMASQVINFTASHDEVRPEHEIKYYSWQKMKRPPGMSVPELALRKAKLGLVALFAAPGVPLIYAGQEYGEDAPRTIDFCPLNWNRLDRISHVRHVQLVRRLVATRKSSTALRGDHILFADDDFARDRVVRFRRGNPDGEVALVALNFGETTCQVSLDVPYAGAWYDVVSNHMRHLTAGPATYELGPWQAVLLTCTPSARNGDV
jgi:1,4-alpha-glucan branching enzyme